MKSKLYFSFLLNFIIISIVFAQQPSYLNTGDFTGNTWNVPEAMSAGLGNSYVITKTSSATGTRYFRFASGTSGWTNFGPATDNTAITFGTKQSISTTGTDYNCTLEATNTTDNFVFKTNDSKELVVFRVQGDVQTISSTSRMPSGVVVRNADVKITANLSGSLSTGQSIYLRFSKDNWTTSTVREMTGSETTYSTYVYGSENSGLGITVRYYLFTSGSGLTIAGSDADLFTINYLNNSGSNYSYTTSESTPNVTMHSGNWDDNTNWSKNSVPGSSDHVVLNHNITLNTSTTIASLTINSSAELTSESGQARNLTISSGNDFNCNGTFTANDGKVSFLGMNTVCGTVSFFDVDLSNNYLDFGTTSTITGTFSINSGTVSNYPTYADNSTLIYKTNGSRTPSTEWRTNFATGRGVPYNIQVTGGTTNTSLQFSGSSSWSLRGSFTIDASQTVFMSSSSGGDIYIKGNLINNGTLNATGSYNREIILEGSAAQSIRTNGSIIEYLKIDNTGPGVTLDDNLTISKRLIMNRGNIDCNGNVLFISNGTADDNSANGIVRNAGIIYNTTSYKLKRTISAGNNGNYLFPIGTSAVYCPINVEYTTAATVDRNLFADLTYQDGGTAIADINDAGFVVNTRSNSFWRLSLSGGTDGAVTLSITNPNQTGIGSAQDLRILQASGESFVFVGSHSNGSGTTAKRTIDISIYGITGQYYMGGNSSTNPLPVELTSFTANANGNKVILNWITSTETKNYGFEIERTPTTPGMKNSNIPGGSAGDGERWKVIGFVEGSGNSNSPKHYEFIDNNLSDCNFFIYRLKMIDTDGSFEYSNEVEVIVSPTEFYLSQNFPNPFNPVTKIIYQLPENAKVNLVVYSVTGEKISELINEEQQVGTYNIEFNRENLCSGIYFYKLTAEGKSGELKTEIRKMIYLK